MIIYLFYSPACGRQIHIKFIFRESEVIIFFPDLFQVPRTLGVHCVIVVVSAAIVVTVIESHLLEDFKAPLSYNDANEECAKLPWQYSCVQAYLC